MDINDQGYLIESNIQYWLNGLSSFKYSNNPNLINDVINEIFDMINPKELRKITLIDLINCDSADIIFDILLYNDGFMNFEIKQSSG